MFGWMIKVFDLHFLIRNKTKVINQRIAAQKRWEVENNQSFIPIFYPPWSKEILIAVGYLIEPEQADNSILNFKELRLLAIREGTFKPFPS